MPRDKNIFDAAAKQLSRNIKQKNEKSSSFLKNLPNNISQDPEVKAMMEQIQLMKNDLQNKMDQLKIKGKLSDETFAKMMNDPKYFTPEQWKGYQQAKEKLESKIWNAIRLPVKQEEMKSAEPEIRTEPKTAGTHQDRKAKTLGVRKKWIPMR